MLTDTERAILGTLLNWGATPGWELWADEEGVASQLKLPTQADSAGYKIYKRTLDKLVMRGLIVNTTGERKLHKALWSATEAGQAEWSPRVADEDKPVSDDVQSYIGKRIKSEGGAKPIPRDVWRVLMEKHKTGELDIAFLPSKKTGGGKK